MRRLIVTLTTAGILMISLLPAASATPSRCNGLTPTITADSEGALIVGTNGDDVILGSAGDDTIYGFGGHDTICGLGGHDVISGGRGWDHIEGGRGADKIHGNTGNDSLYGDEGNDAISGGNGDDTAFGDVGNDKLRGGSGNDTLYGGDGEDDLFGAAGNDMLDGGDSHDYLHGGFDDDHLIGGAGEDEMWGRGGSDVLLGGADADILKAGYGVDQCAGELLGGCEKAPVSPGDSGWHVKYLQTRLAEEGFYRGAVDGTYPVDSSELPGQMTAAVYAFHKLHQDPQGESWHEYDHVSLDWTLDDWEDLDVFEPLPPKARSGEPNRLEVDAHHEVMWLILDGDVAGIFHVSRGGEYRYWYNGGYRIAHTPRGSFDIDSYSYGTKTPGYQYKSWYFEQSYYAVHGFYKVPPYPASHGCVRVVYDDADWLTQRLEIGWPIHIWDE